MKIICNNNLIINEFIYLNRLLVQECPQHISALVTGLDTHHSMEMQSVTMVAVFAQVSCIILNLIIPSIQQSLHLIHDEMVFLASDWSLIHQAVAISNQKPGKL